ncbi:hypothetical protein CDAR_226551 [Caerostris darwini]|uniref:Uncharacterized protein n=1 Tax=Caerostris darwini TaxID=1538125 RepID=A0AAV4WLE8_9ARAC|nr:hypothetical protein CDAR_226551 [Caerostris darwini]
MKVHPFLDNKTYPISLSIRHCGELPHTEILYRNRRDFPVGNADFLPIDPRRSFFEKTVVVSCYLEEVHSHADDLSDELMIYQKLSDDLKNFFFFFVRKSKMFRFEISCRSTRDIRP